MESETAILFVNEGDRLHGQSVVGHVMRVAISEHLSGATAFRAIEGFGSHLKLHRDTLLSMSDNEGVAILVVDSPDKIERCLARLSGDGLHCSVLRLNGTLETMGTPS